MNKSAYERRAGKGKSISDRLRENGVISMSPKWKKWAKGGLIGGIGMIDIHPTKCNICGGKVIYTSNAEVYGREYGSGYCYLCTNCGAYVGTHKPRPKDALGLLADKRMREGKKCCHALFDPLWQNKPYAREERRKAYKWLADKMGIDPDDCHFGYFDLEQLKKAYRILFERTNAVKE